MKTPRILPLLVLGLLGLLVPAASASTASDLVLEDVRAARPSALAGEQVTVDATVRNLGTVAAGASRLKYYFSSDDVLDAADRYLNYDDVPALEAGGRNDETANVRVPAGTPDGSWYVLAVADFDGDVAELDETNNVVAIPITVGEVPLGDGPDLGVEGAALDAIRAYPGEVVTASARVTNHGTRTAGASQLEYVLSRDLAWSEDDAYLNYDAVPALAVGDESAETANLRVPAETPDGLYYVLFVPDANGEVVELDEGGVIAVPLLVGDAAARADLSLEGARVGAAEVRAGETLPVSATVRNIGVLDAPASRLVYYLSTDAAWDAADRQLSYDSVDALAPFGRSDEEAALRVTSATAAGSYHLLFVADADGAVAEADEANVVAVPVMVTRDDPDAIKPDLELEHASLEGAGDAFTASVTVANRGVAGAGESRLIYYLSTDAVLDDADRYLNYDNVGALAVGDASFETASFTVDVDGVEAGSYVLFVADANDDVPERYESDNVLALPLRMDGGPGGPVDDPDAIAPDLMITAASVDAIEVRAGDRATLRCRVENVGDHPAAAESRVKYYLSRDARFDATDAYLSYDTVPPLAPAEISDEDVTPLIPATAAHGRWYLLAVADAAEEVTETFESNNVAAVPIEVTVDDPTLDAPDLAPASPRLDRGAVGAGRKVDVTVSIVNQGVRASTPARVKYYLSADGRRDASDAYLAYRDLGALSIGAAEELTADVRIPMTANDGAGYVLVVIDSERAVTERYESNNVIAVPITIGEDEAPAPPYPYACPDTVFTDGALLARHTVATLNALHLGYSNQKDMTALACVASHFDLLGLEEVEEPQGVTDLERALEALTGERWSSHVSPHPVGYATGMEYYGFVWRDAEVTMTAPRGYYPDPGDRIKREPYAADFRMGAFDFTYVIFHLQYGQTLSTRRFEANQLAEVYAWAQADNGAESDVLIGGDFNLAGDEAAFTLVGVDGITYVTDPEQPTSIGTSGLANSFDNIFYSRDFTREVVASGAHDYTMANWSEVLVSITDHIPVWVEVDTSVDDD